MFSVIPMRLLADADVSWLSLRRVHCGLTNFLRRERVVKLSQSPEQFFVKEQMCLTAYEFLIRTRKKVLTRADVTDNTYNMFELLEDMSSKSVPATHLGIALCEELLSLVSEIADDLESSWRISLQALRDSIGNVPPARSTLIQLPSIGSFQKHRLIGQGGFGTIYRTKFGRTSVALKIINTQAFRHYRNVGHEKAASSLLRHPRIVTMHASFRCSGGHILLMEAVDGLDLYRLTRCFRNLSYRITKCLTAQLLSAVMYMHFSGFLHKDIKPSNVIVMSGCALKLCDFDTCKISIGKYPALKSSRNFNRRTCAEFSYTLFNGTVTYAAPEIINEQRYGRAADWWSVGLTNYHMYCGSSPFRFSRTVSRQRMACVLRTCTIVYPAWCSDAVDFLDFSKRLLDKDPRSRLGSKSYRDLVKHKYFSGISWSAAESSKKVLMDEQIEHMLKTKKGLFLKMLLHKKKRRKPLIKLTALKDSPKQYPLFTFVSEDFGKLLTLTAGDSNSSKKPEIAGL